LIRLGSGDNGFEDIMNHAFFKDVDWELLLQRDNTDGAFEWWPEPPEFTIQDFQNEFPKSIYNLSQIKALYYGKDDDII